MNRNMRFGEKHHSGHAVARSEAVEVAPENSSAGAQRRSAQQRFERDAVPQQVGSDAVEVGKDMAAKSGRIQSSLALG